MAAIRATGPLPPPLHFGRTLRRGASSSFRPPAGSESSSGKGNAPPLLRVVVSAVTELLRLAASPKTETKTRSSVEEEGEEELVAQSVDDVVSLLRSDYNGAYFLTGDFTPSIYSDDCLFEDPTIRFRGKKQYSRNLELLIPFLDCPSLELKKIEKGVNHDEEYILATWKLRTYLRFPWKPLISIDGCTVYDLSKKFKIVRHAESWSVSALEAVCQIFSPSRKDSR